MGLLSNLRDKYLVAPVASKILQTLKPVDDVQKADTPNVFSVPIGFNTSMANYNKRMVGGGVDFQLLRSISVNHETTRAAINTRKRQITQLGFDIVDVDDDADPTTSASQRQVVKELVTNLGGPGVRFRELLDKMIEDLLVLDALCFYKQRTRGGQLLRIIPIDGATIKLRVDDSGSVPLPPDIAFEQWIKGSMVAEMTTDDLSYELMNPRTDTPYGLSPIESLILSLDASMRAMLFNLSYLSDNSVPIGFLNVPEGWNVNQIKEYTEYLHSMISGPKAQAKVYPIPAGATYQPVAKPSDFAFKDFFEYLDRKVCMMFDLAPQELGINLQQYKENAEGQDKIQMRKGIKPLANFLSEIFTEIIQNEFGFTEFAFKFTGLDSRFTTDEVKIKVPLGILGIDEVRNDMGLSKLGVDNFILAGNTVVPVNQVGMPITVSGNQAQPTNTDQPKTAVISAKELQKIARNLGLEAVEKKRQFKSFKKVTKMALEEQIRPFTKESTIDEVTKTEKADLEDTLATNIEENLSSVEIQGLDDYLKWSAEQGGQNAYKALNLSETFKLTNPKFKALLGDRSNYLIDSVDSTTKDWLINRIVDGKASKLTNAEIADQISSDMDEITDSRADTIVNTEVANAMQTAELDTYSEQGVTKKVWVLSEDVGDECGDNADAGPIGIDEVFPSGDDAPPLHPNCRCFIQADVDSIS